MFIFVYWHQHLCIRPIYNPMSSSSPETKKHQERCRHMGGLHMWATPSPRYSVVLGKHCYLGAKTRKCRRMGRTIFIHIHIYICMCTLYTRSMSYSCLSVCICINTYNCRYIYMYTYMYIHLYIYICLCMYICMHNSVRSNVYIHIYTHIYICVYVVKGPLQEAGAKRKGI